MMVPPVKVDDRVSDVENCSSSDDDRAGLGYMRSVVVVRSPVVTVAAVTLMLAVIGCTLAFMMGQKSPADDAPKIAGIKDASQLTEAQATCGTAPQLRDQALDKLIDTSSEGVLIIANPHMKCTEAVVAALNGAGIAYELEEFDCPFEYSEGASATWDWLHCMYPDDENMGAIMHSYVFANGEFQGQGFAAAEKVGTPAFGISTSDESCEDRFPDQADILKHYMENEANKVLLFGWIECPCTADAQGRLASSSVCYEGRTWEDPNSQLMAYLQCRDGTAQDHSFIYFRKEGAPGGWDYVGNGFLFAEGAMPQEEFEAHVSSAAASKACEQANVKVNVYGDPLQECRTDPSDMAGSWQDDGTCSEQFGGVHEICIENLPADFSTATHQTPWSEDRAKMRHCVCIGAWSLYMTDAEKHKENAEEIMPHCKAIPETALTERYVANWKDWNGYPASVVHGIGELVQRCLKQESSEILKCGLMKRFTSLAEQVPELGEKATDLQQLWEELDKLDCA